MSGIILRLSLLALVCGVALSASNYLSKGRISANQIEYEAMQLRSILGDAEVSITRGQSGVYRVLSNDQIIGHIFELSTNQGYNGQIRLMLAVSVNNTVLGVRVIEHRETPGLADDLDINVSDWMLAFNGHSLQSIRWGVRKDDGDFDQFTGATITPRAVVAAVQDGLRGYEENKDTWMAL